MQRPVMSTTDKYVRLVGVGIKGATEKLGYNLPQQNQGQVIQRVFGNKQRVMSGNERSCYPDHLKKVAK